MKDDLTSSFEFSSTKAIFFLGWVGSVSFSLFGESILKKEEIMNFLMNKGYE